MKIIKGNLITLALQGSFDVIAQGCNCFNTQRAGLAKQMVKYFDTNLFPMELKGKGDWNKLGQIDYQLFYHKNGIAFNNLDPYEQDSNDYDKLYVVNCYTQYYHLGNLPNCELLRDIHKPFVYDAFTLCMTKINSVFNGRGVGLPLIGCGLAKGDRKTVLNIMKRTLTNVDLTVVEYDKVN